jgi:peroxiredoxin
MNTLQSCLTGILLAFAAALPEGTGDTAKSIDFKFASMDDKALRLSDYCGKWVLVSFWAPWCSLYWREVPALNAFDAREDVVVIGVVMDYGKDRAAVR